jgi:O-antigen ligase
MSHALKMWLDSPIFGIGLGTFIARSPEFLVGRFVIHSTPLWLLTEFGLFGVSLLAWSCRNFIKYIFKKDFSRVEANHASLVLVLIAFGIFGLFHEIFYQRLFWFSLGALLAVSGDGISKNGE